MKVGHPGGAVWTYDTIEEYLADHRRYRGYSYLNFIDEKAGLQIYYNRRETSVAVYSHKRQDVERILDVFERNLDSAKLEPLSLAQVSLPVIFIGHGRDMAWRDLKDHLHDKHFFAVEAYEVGSRAGHTIRDIVEEMADKSSFALLVLSKEDEQQSGEYRARQNVIHEAGVFQGKLGFSRAVLLVENGVELPSNLQGVQYIPYSSGGIRETFGDVLALLRREFSARP